MAQMDTEVLECPIFQKIGTGFNVAGLGMRAIALGESREAAATLVDGLGISLANGYLASGSNRHHAFEVNADTGSTDLAGDTYVGAIRGRMLVGTTQTNASIIAVLGDLSIGSAKNISANFFAVRGHLDFWGNCTISGSSFVGALSAYLENEGTTTVGAGQHLDGVDIYQVGSPSVNATGLNAAINIRGTWREGFNFVGSCVSAKAAGAAAALQILIRVDGAAYALSVCAVGTT